MNASTCICENIKFLKSVADASVNKCDGIVIVMDNLSTKKTNAIATNVTSIASVNWHSKKVRDCYVLHSVLLAFILLYNYYYLLSLCKKKVKRKIMDLKYFVLKIVGYYVDDITKLEDW